MRILVVGAGVVGVTTAYFLRREGHDVTVVEREASAALGTSFANGGQLSYSFTDSLAKPSFLAQLPGLLLGRDPGSLVRIDRRLIGWGIRFLRQCTPGNARRNTLALLGTAMRSAELMAAMRRELDFDFEHREAGKLILLCSDAEIAAARHSADIKRTQGCNTEILSPAEATRLEPALAAIDEPFKAAVYAAGDHIGDSRLFSERLAAHLSAKRGVEFRFGCEVHAIATAGRRFTALELDGESLHADALVVCAGTGSEALLRPTGLRMKIYPVRGYSVTLPASDDAPSLSVTLLRRRMLLGRLGDTLRVTGFADFVGDRRSADTRRQQDLLNLARTLAPRAADYTAGDPQAWADNRPMTPDGQPVVGPTAIGGLYLNAGHGMLGWTLAAACAEEIARCLKPRAR